MEKHGEMDEWKGKMMERMGEELVGVGQVSRWVGLRSQAWLEKGSSNLKSQEERVGRVVSPFRHHNKLRHYIKRGRSPLRKGEEPGSTQGLS